MKIEKLLKSIYLADLAMVLALAASLAVLEPSEAEALKLYELTGVLISVFVTVNGLSKMRELT